ncbi:MAG: SusC/RagA family TonB-linked outer membrane protein, partial [Bacteroidales bacterium]|nr:SusC/RagA family TonB-linked outer membrane protein [Bacteroidales bacterium]
MKMLHKKSKISNYLIICLLAVFPFGLLEGQVDSVEVAGTILDSDTNEGLNMVSISVASTGVVTSTNEEGEFTIKAPNYESEIMINMPGYTSRNIFLGGESTIEIYLVPKMYRSTDDMLVSPLEVKKAKQMNFAFGALRPSDFESTTVSSFDQGLQGKVAGLSVTSKTAMPGQRTYMNIRGASSLLTDNEPLLLIDGMIHNYTNVGPSLIEGFTLNPLDVLDVEDIQNVTVLKDGVSYLGSLSSGGIININTEQESEASTRIKITAYGGLALSPSEQSVLGADEYPGYLENVLGSQGFSQVQIDNYFPWINGELGVKDYYKNHNSTNWQDIVLKPGIIQKYHFFLKGGDEIATYNIATGILNHEGIYDNSSYNRFNLKINGKVNISKKFSIQPNVKLSVGNTEVHNQGYSSNVNPLTTALLKPPIATTHARDEITGDELPNLQDVGFADVSNPLAVVDEAIGSIVNYNFLSSIKANFALTDHLKASTLLGIDYSNTHEDIFLQNLGIASSDSLKANSPGYFVNEFQSVQNHSNIQYTNSTASGHNYTAFGGFRFMSNNYKYNSALDFNTASDEFNNLGQGGSYTYLRELIGEQRESVWVSYYTGLNYIYRNKIFLEANLSYDGSSALDGKQRYNLFPSVATGYQLNSMLKLRGSYSLTGNMFSTIYDYADLYYIGRLFNDQGVIVRETISNPDMEIEKKSTYNFGADLSLYREKLNLFVDIYQSDVKNMLMYQALDQEWGYTNYVDNGGHVRSRGVELALNSRLDFGKLLWTMNATAAIQSNNLVELNFLSDGVDQVVTEFVGGAMVTRVGEAPNVFYGYNTDGIYQTAAEANNVIGPNGQMMQAGDVRFVENEDHVDNIINSDDLAVIGDPNPDVFGGFYTTLKLNK